MKLKLGNKLQKWVLLPALITFLWIFPVPSLKWSPLISTAYAGFFNNDLETFEEIINLVANKYVYSPDHKKLFSAAIKQMVKTADSPNVTLTNNPSGSTVTSNKKTTRFFLNYYYIRQTDKKKLLESNLTLS